MLQTFAEMLTKFLDFERRDLDRQKISHAPSIGAMYEGLTRAGLEGALPPGLNLAVTSGFAEAADGTLSDQLDCMLVVGDGRVVPHTDMHIYPIDQVIAVVEVKKSLYTADVAAGHDNLRSVVRLGSSPSASRSTIRIAFQSITGRPLPDDISELPSELAIIHQLLVVEAAVPVRIVLGYHGYQGETGLRRGLTKHLSKLVGMANYGPLSLPNVVLNRNAVAVKTNGMPWEGPMRNGWWPVMVTSGQNSPITALLDAIFSRLNQRGLLEHAAFGEDLDREAWNVLFEVRFNAARNGWEGRAGRVETGDTAAAPSGDRWSPIFLTRTQHDLIVTLCANSELNLETLISDGADVVSLSSDIEHLERGRLVGRDAKRPNIVRLLTSRCRTGRLPDGRYFAGEDESGRLTRWVDAYIRQRAGE